MTIQEIVGVFTNSRRNVKTDSSRSQRAGMEGVLRDDKFEVEEVVTVTFLVVPEFPFGSIAAVAAIFAAVLVSGKVRF